MNPARSVSVLALALCWWPALADPTPSATRVDRVVVLDAEYAVIGQLASSRQLLEFNDFWQAKVTQSIPVSTLEVKSFSIKLDIRAAQAGGRWLYRPDGYLLRAASEGSTLFKVPNPQAFNALIGVVPQR